MQSCMKALASNYEQIMNKKALVLFLGALTSKLEVSTQKY